MESCEHTPETLHGETACVKCGLVLDEPAAIPDWPERLNHGTSMRPNAETRDYMTIAPGRFRRTQIMATERLSRQIRAAKIVKEIKRLAYVFSVPRETVNQAVKIALEQPHDFTLHKPLAAASLLLASSANSHPIPLNQILKHVANPKATRRVYTRLRAKYLPVAPDSSKAYLEKITATLRYTPTEKQLARIILEQISPKASGVIPYIKAATAATLASYRPGRLSQVAEVTPCTEVGIRTLIHRIFGYPWIEGMHNLYYRNTKPHHAATKNE